MGSLSLLKASGKFRDLVIQSNRQLESMEDYADFFRVGGNAFDLHVHSSRSPDTMFMDIASIAERAKTIGLKGVAITDHNDFMEPVFQRAVERVFEKQGIIYIPGVEVTLRDNAHILLLFSEYSGAACTAVRRILNVLASEELGLDGVIQNIKGILAETKQRVKCDFKEAVIIAHPSSILGRPALSSKLNDNADRFNGVEAQTYKCVKFAKKHKLAMIAGSDAHMPMLLGIGHTQLEAETRKEVIERILAGKTQASPQYKWWCPFLKKHRELGPEFTDNSGVFCRF